MTASKIRWGLLSTARINDRMITAVGLSARSEILAVASRDPEHAREYSAARGIPRAHGTYEEVIADPEIDAVYISLPNSLHAEWAIRAAAAGKHILCEKPLALTSEEVDRMMVAAKASRVLLQEASMMRCHPQTAKLRELVQGGVIGEVRVMRGWFSFMLSRPGDIRMSAALGGGSLWDLGCYPVTLFRSVIGADPINVVGWQVLSNSGVDLTFAGQICYRNGTVAQIDTSIAAIPSWGAEILGSEGTIRVTYPWLSHLGVTSDVHILAAGSDRSASTFGDGTEHLHESTVSYTNINAYVDQLLAFEATVLDGAAPIFPLEESRSNIATLQALHSAASSGSRAAVPGLTYNKPEPLVS